MKSIWKGSISFGLVNIPIKLYSAVQQHAFGFTMLHAKCHTPLSYHRWCMKCDKEIAWEDVVKGLPLKKGSYLILTQEKLAELKAVQTEQIQIVEFIDNALVPPLHINAHYYIEPTLATNSAYFLFVAALKKSDKAAIGQFVLKDREHVCAIQEYNNGLLLTTLNYAYEIKEQPTQKMAPPMSKKELALAEQLINKLTVKKFNIESFKDSFAQKLKAHLKEAEKTKKTGKKVKATKKITKAARTTKVTLLHQLQESLHGPRARA